MSYGKYPPKKISMPENIRKQNACVTTTSSPSQIAHMPLLRLTSFPPNNSCAVSITPVLNAMYRANCAIFADGKAKY